MLAIVIPFYKLTFFEETLKSLVRQTDKRFKVYIGDDASPENPLDLLKKVRGQFDLEYVRFETNIGSYSLGKQLKRCIGMIGDEEWLMLLGDDDYLSKDVVKNWYYYYKDFYNKAEVIRFSSIMLDINSDSNTKVFKHPKWENGINSYYRRYIGQSRSTLSEYIFSKKAYLNYGISNYPLAWHSDDKMWLDYSFENKIYSINESPIYIRISNLSISGKQDNLDLKKLAENQFFHYLIKNRIETLDNDKSLEFVLAYEISIKKIRKPILKDWLFLLPFYIKYFEIFTFLKFFRRVFNNIFIYETKGINNNTNI